ncbi:MAG: winged helix-turn-helix transcriptional regulator [Planctomycetota bacterium]|nr:winged helix-turn-helix transcriptional regulator [Planctomycetota bacterium]
MPPTLAPLVELSHHRWVLPLVAAIGSGQRFAVLLRQLDTNRQSLKRALGIGEQLGLVTPNPGYGHPLRPEYLLTPRGQAIAPEASEVLRTATRAGWSELLTKKWSLPVLTAVRLGADRYSKIEELLETASPRAISRALDELAGPRLIRRAEPCAPRPRYLVAPAARRLARCGVALAEVGARAC